MTHAPTSFPFRGFYVGSVAAAVLFAFGIELLVGTVRDPLAAWLTDAINYIIRTGRFEVVLLQRHIFSWEIAGFTASSGAAALLLGFWLGAWVSRAATEDSRAH